MMETILIATPDNEWASAATAEISSEGFEVVWVSDGHEACECATRIVPNFVILDTILPVYDGLETCRLLRSDPTLPRTLPVFLTGTVAPSRKFLEEAGATGFISKQTAGADLRELLVDYLRAYGKS